jgi:hypothetical protein
MEVEKPIQQYAEELNQSIHYLHGLIAIDYEQSQDYLDYVYETPQNPVQLTDELEKAARGIGRLYVASMAARDRKFEKFQYQEQIALSLLGGRSSLDAPMSLLQITRFIHQGNAITTPWFQRSLRVTSDAVVRLRSRAEADPSRMVEAYEYLINPKPPKGKT